MLILKCDFRHAGQDAIHGDGMRKYRCTVCRREPIARDERIKPPKDAAPAGDAKPNGEGRGR